MKKASIIVHQNYLKDIVKNLHETGLMEIIDITKEQSETEDKIKEDITNHEEEICTNYEYRFSKLINILTQVSPRKSGIKAILHPDSPEVITVKDKTLDELYSHADNLLNKVEKNILENEQKLCKINEEIKKIYLKIQQINYIKDFDLDVSDVGESKYLIVKAGKTTDIETIKKQIESLESPFFNSKQFGAGKKIEWAVLIATYISEKEKIERICRENITEFNFEGLSGFPKDVLKSLENEKEKIEKEKKLIVKLLCDVASHYINNLLALREELQLERVKMEVLKNFAKTNFTYIINGWVLEKNQDVLRDFLVNVTNDHIICNFESPSINPDNPPTYFETPKWAVTFKTILELFATPKYNEVNPTLFIGIFFILFFGFMLGDAGYGLIILFLSLYGYIKLGKHSPFLKNWSFLGIWLGLTTTIVGFLTNGFFADLIPRFIYGDPDKPLYSLDVMGVHLPIDALGDPITMLSIALILALIHLNLGIILGLYQSFRRKDYKSLFTQHGSWIPLQLGGGLLIGYFIFDWRLETITMYAAIILTVLGIILLFIYNRGPLGFFSITGYIGDWLSYARLLALGLSTAGMALAINIVGKLTLTIPIIGVIIFVIIMIFAHIANLGVQSLGAAVHSLRLQYIEFFNRFYEGGGREFTPFKIRRIYTKTEEVVLEKKGEKI